MENDEQQVREAALATGLPTEVLNGSRKMTRKERRKWYHENRKKMKLTPWGQLHEITK